MLPETPGFVYTKGGPIHRGCDVSACPLGSFRWRIAFCGLLLLAAVPLTARAAPVVAGTAAPLAAPAPPPPYATLRFEHLSIEHGLSQSTVSVILQDSFGFMWFGTDDGLNRYDGYQFRVYRHDPDDPAGLSQGGIREIYEDSTGDLWLRTSSGALDRFDRDTSRFIHYRRAEGGIGLRDEDFAWDIYEDRSGILWVGTYLSGLFRYDRNNDRFDRYHHDPGTPPSLSDDRVYAIYEDRAGELWIGTAEGLDRLDRRTDRFIHYQHKAADPTSLAGERVQLIYEDSQGRLWLAIYGAGLDLFDRTSGQVTRYTHDPANPQTIDETMRIRSLYEDSAGYLWLLHSDGRLDRLDPQTGVFRRFRGSPAAHDSAIEGAVASAGPGDEFVSFIKEDRSGNLWVGTHGGLDRFDRDTEQYVHYRHTPYDASSLSDNQLLTFFEDRAGGLWLGTFGHGVDRFDPGQLDFPHYRIEPQAPDAGENNIVWDIRQDASGLLWIGSTAGLSSFDRSTGQVTRYRHDPADPTSLSRGRVWSVFEDVAGRLWVGTESSLDLLDRATGRFTHSRNVPDDPGADYGHVTALLDDGAGGLWLGVYGRGLEHFDPATATFKHYEHHLGEVQASLSFYREVWTVYRAADGWLWIGTTRGLYGFQPDTGAAVRYTHDPADPSSLSSNEVHSILEDRSGRLWVGTWGGGLNELDRATGEFVHYTIRDGLPNNTIYCILEDLGQSADAVGDLWLSTNNGLARFDPSRGSAALTRSFRNYDVGDGLQSNEFNTGACSMSPEGEMFFGGVNGFNAFDPARIQEDRAVPPVVLTSLTRGGQALSPERAVEGLTELTLRWPHDSFEFEFAALNYSQPAKSRYTYMLAPLETAWTQAGSRRYGNYTNLPGGTYTLRLRATNSAGVWSEEGARLTITVIPPFWETRAFWVLVGLMLAAMTVAAYGWRVASIESRSRRLAIEVAERTLTIAEQAADLEALYQADEELERHVELDQVLQALVDIAVDRLQADKSAVLSWDTDRQRLVIRVARNFSAEAVARISFSSGEGYISRVMEGGEPAIVVDAESDLRRVPGRPEVVAAILNEGIRSFMHILIRVVGEGGATSEGSVSPGEVFGVFTVCYNTSRAFGEREQRLFTALAQRAALAVQNAQSFAAEQRRAEQFRVIGEVGRDLASILDINELLTEIVRLIQRTFGYDHVGLALIEGDAAVYRVGAGKLWENPAFTFSPNHFKVGTDGSGEGPEGITGWVALTGEPLLVPDTNQEPRYVWMQGSSTRSELTVPLKLASVPANRPTVIGVLDAQSDRINAFDESDLAVMQSLANQAAIAIENARLYENSNRQVAQLTALQETSRAIASTLERDALLKLIMAQATALLDADGGLINLVDWEQREDEVVASSGVASQFLGAHNALDDGLSGWVTLYNQPVISNRLAEDDRVASATREWLEKSRVESAALAPLVVKGQVVGTLVLIKQAGQGGFDEADRELLVAFADQAAIAIENARLYEEAQAAAALEERSRLARDLHDAVTQTLFSASLIAEALPALWETNPAEGRALLEDLRQLTRGALAEMRTLLLELRPAALVESHLADVLRQLAESVSGRSGIPVKVIQEGCALLELPERVHVALYRIAQEALNNVVKHAQARQVEVRLVCADMPALRVELSIADDGKGFDPAVIPPAHLGLGIIRERAEAIGAELRIDSEAGRGTVIAVLWHSAPG